MTKATIDVTIYINEKEQITSTMIGDIDLDASTLVVTGWTGEIRTTTRIKGVTEMLAGQAVEGLKNV